MHILFGLKTMMKCCKIWWKINQGASFKSITKQFQNDNSDPMFNIENIVKHIQHINSKHQKINKIDLIEIYQSIKCQLKKITRNAWIWNIINTWTKLKLWKYNRKI